MTVDTQKKRHVIKKALKLLTAPIFGLAFVSYWVLVARSFLVLNHVTNDLHEVGLALHNYHEEYGSFPPYVEKTADGKVRTWRSIIRRQLGLRDQDKEFFPAADGSRWGRPYQFFAVIGPDAAWTDGHPRKISEFKDGTSDTILLIGIRHSGVRWQEPVDLHVRGDALFLGDREVDLTSDVFLLMADGSTRYQQKGLRPDQLHPLLTVAAGDAVQEW